MRKKFKRNFGHFILAQFVTLEFFLCTLDDTFNNRPESHFQINLSIGEFFSPWVIGERPFFLDLCEVGVFGGLFLIF